MYTSCSETEEKKPVADGIELDDDYYEFQTFDMADFGIDGYISLPDETANIGASTKPEVMQIESHLWQIDVGLNFTLHIEDMANLTDIIKEEKKDLASKKFFKVKYLVDKPDMIIYERTLVVSGTDKASKTVGKEHKSYHVFGQRKVNGIMYALESQEEGYNKTIIELMAKSIRSFKGKKSS